MRALLFLAIIGFAATSARADDFQAGASVADVTPDRWPVSLSGSFDPRGAESAHDPLYVRAMAMQNGEGRAVIALVDSVGVPREVCDEMKALAAEQSGWSASEILVAATHTHSAPPASGGGTPPGMAFREKLIKGGAGAIVNAIEALQPAAAGWGVDAVDDEVRNRRWYLEPGAMPPNPFGEMDTVKMNPGRRGLVKPAGPVDTEVSVLNLRTRRGKPLAVLSNYALHYVGGVPRGQVSGDYFGEFARLIPFRLGGSNPPENFVGILSNGTSGDINNIDFAGKRPPREPFEQIRIVAGKVADATWRATREIDHDPGAVVAMVQREVELKKRVATEDQMAWAKRVLAMSDDELAKQPKRASNYARRVLSIGTREQKEKVLIQAIRVGEQAIVSMPFEVLVEIGLEIKEKSPFEHTFIIELANGSSGYLPPPNQHDLGGYETWLGTSKVEREASVILTKHLLEMLGELKGG